MDTQPQPLTLCPLWGTPLHVGWDHLPAQVPQWLGDVRGVSIGLGWNGKITYIYIYKERLSSLHLRFDLCLVAQYSLLSAWRNARNLEKKNVCKS